MSPQRTEEAPDPIAGRRIRNVFLDQSCHILEFQNRSIQIIRLNEQGEFLGGLLGVYVLAARELVAAEGRYKNATFFFIVQLPQVGLDLAGATPEPREFPEVFFRSSPDLTGALTSLSYRPPIQTDELVATAAAAAKPRHRHEPGQLFGLPPRIHCPNIGEADRIF